MIRAYRYYCTLLHLNGHSIQVQSGRVHAKSPDDAVYWATEREKQKMPEYHIVKIQVATYP